MDFSPSQSKALKLMKEGKNLYLTGKGGSGKSTLVNHFMETKEKPAVVAPTGTAAINVGGSTCHQLFGLVPQYKNPIEYYNKFATEASKHEDLRDEKVTRIISLIKSFDVLIIDEVGMVRSDVFSAMDLICRAALDNLDEAFGGLQVVCVGDLYQLPPIVTRDERNFIKKGSEWFFMSPGYEMGNFLSVELKEIHRQKTIDENGNIDENAVQFVDALNSIREGSPNYSQIEFLNERIKIKPKSDSVVLCSLRKQMFEINKQKLEELPGRFVPLESESYGDLDNAQFPVEKTIWVKRGAKVMLLTNNREGGWHNGTIGTYLGKKGDMIFIEANGRKLAVQKHEFEQKKYIKTESGEVELETVASMSQFPIQLSWAITIHKAQGKTLDNMHLDLGTGGAFSHGQLYVGLSRCSSYEGLTLEHPIKDSDVLCDDSIKEFMYESV